MSGCPGWRTTVTFQHVSRVLKRTAVRLCKAEAGRPPHPIWRVRFLTPRSPSGASRRRPAQLGELPFPPIHAFSRNVESGDRASVLES
jgi:hypothetical protein